MEKHEKEQLGNLLAKGHTRYGRVAPRRPYLDDSDGDGAPGINFETHPLLANLPDGAASDLTKIITNNNQASEEALNRSEELTLTLKQQPTLQAQLQSRQQYTPKNTPY